MARNKVVRSVRSFLYTVKAANKESCTVDTFTVSVPTNLKHPEKSLKNYMPDNYVFIAVDGEPRANISYYACSIEDFMAIAKPYTPSPDEATE